MSKFLLKMFKDLEQLRSDRMVYLKFWGTCWSFAGILIKVYEKNFRVMEDKHAMETANVVNG